MVAEEGLQGRFWGLKTVPDKGVCVCNKEFQDKGTRGQRPGAENVSCVRSCLLILRAKRSGRPDHRRP